MVRIIKLTAGKDQTHGGTQWGEYTTNMAKGEGVQLCSPDLIHGYEDELIAVFMDPAHGGYLSKGGHAWLAEADEIVAGDGLKVGVKKLTTLRRIELPSVTPEQRVVWGILHAMEVYDEPGFVSWANAWLSGKDRSSGSANAAADAAKYEAADAAAKYGAADAAAYAAKYGAYEAAYAAKYAAAYAAYAAADAAYAADAAAKYAAAYAADAAADAAYAAKYAAYEAAYAAKYAAKYAAAYAAADAAYAADAAREAIRTGKKIDHKAIARKAMEY